MFVPSNFIIWRHLSYLLSGFVVSELCNLDNGDRKTFEKLCWTIISWILHLHPELYFICSACGNFMGTSLLAFLKQIPATCLLTLPKGIEMEGWAYSSSPPFIFPEASLHKSLLFPSIRSAHFLSLVLTCFFLFIF